MLLDAEGDGEDDVAFLSGKVYDYGILIILL